MSDLDRMLRGAREGDPRAAKELVGLLHAELRELAARAMARERSDHTLQPTALVNEAYLRLVGGDGASFEGRDEFFAAAANTLRRVLVDHARTRAREKRGGGALRVPLEGLDVAAPVADEDLLTLDEALADLAVFDPGKARIVELRFFAGLSALEIGRVTGASESTVRREWRVARAWLRTRMGDADVG